MNIKTFLENLENINKILEEEIKASSNINELENVRKEFFGKKGKFEILTNDFKNLSLEEKKKVGSKLKESKENSNNIFIEAKKKLILKKIGFPETENFNSQLNKSSDKKILEHPYTNSLKKIFKFFSSIGFEIADGPIVETAEYNFTALNIPENHPARDEHDTFWLKEKNYLLRTHTSSVQVKEAKKRKPPFGLISAGAVYRNEATDATHDFMFWQVEGLFISKEANISNLLYVFRNFFRSFFENENLEIRVRPGVFPFVEPGMELDFECPFCEDGCKICKKTKWIEIGGTGMVHPNVMKAMDIKEENVVGWAFGIGLTRLIMLKYDITDIRKLHNSIF